MVKARLRGANNQSEKSIFPRGSKHLQKTGIRFDSLLFMNSRTSEASVFSCKSGNKNNLFFVWILFCLLPKFLGTPFAIVNLAIDRCPSRALAVETFG
ncbi:hypothetical protein COP2_033965 [Malus domestica]